MSSQYAAQVAAARRESEAMQQEQAAIYAPERIKNLNAGGYDQDENQLRRQSAYNYGSQMGQKEFYDAPDMQMLRKRREDLSQGYDGQELGGMRAEARNQIAGQRANYLNTMKSKLARGGAGGARGAAMQGAADQNYAKQGADSERKLALDSANMKRQGVGDLQDYLFRQKLGKVGLAYGQQALASGDYASEKGVQAAKSGGKK